MLIDLMGIYGARQIVEIPEEGELPAIPKDIVDRYIPKDQLTKREYPTEREVKNQHPDANPPMLKTISVSLIGEQPYTQGFMKHSESYYLDLVWVESRNEWVAFYKRSWVGEDLRFHSEDGLTPWAGLPDSIEETGGASLTYGGPYSLDDYCRDMVDLIK